MIFGRSNRKRFGRVTVVAAHDIFMAALAFELSVWTRYQTYGAPQDFFFLWEATLIFAVVGGLVFWWGGLYRGIWHYASFTDLAAIARAVTVAVLVFHGMGEQVPFGLVPLPLHQMNEPPGLGLLRLINLPLSPPGRDFGRHPPGPYKQTRQEITEYKGERQQRAKKGE